MTWISPRPDLLKETHRPFTCTARRWFSQAAKPMRASSSRHSLTSWACASSLPGSEPLLIPVHRSDKPLPRRLEPIAGVRESPLVLRVQRDAALQHLPLMLLGELVFLLQRREPVVVDG